MCMFPGYKDCIRLDMCMCSMSPSYVECIRLDICMCMSPNYVECIRLDMCMCMSPSCVECIRLHYVYVHRLCRVYQATTGERGKTSAHGHWVDTCAFRCRNRQDLCPPCPPQRRGQGRQERQLWLHAHAPCRNLQSYRVF